jgi:hyaluronate lyase
MSRRTVDGQQIPEESAASDPTAVRDTITVNLWAQYLTPVDDTPAVQVDRTVTGTRLTFTTHHAYGRSITVNLRGS